MLKRVVVVLILLASLSGFAQNIQAYIPLETDLYDYLNYQITGNTFTPYFVLSQPYRFDEVLKETKSYFVQHWQQFFTNQNVHFTLESVETLKWDRALLNRYRFAGTISYTDALVTLVNQTVVDQEYKYDPNFAGDLSEASHWLYGRVNEAYVDIHQPKFNIFVGRTKRNWGLLGEYGLILSSNPYSYDHFLFALHLKFLRLSLIYAPLDTRDALYTDDQNRPVYEVNQARRHLVGHRLEVHVSDDLQLALTEMATYGGENRPFEWAFVNPMNFYYPIQRNDRQQMDGFWCVDVFWRPLSKTTFWGQFLIDDIIVNNDPGVDDRQKYPDRLALLASLRKADWLIPASHWMLTYVRVWNDTYQSKFSWENYHYRGYGLGYPAASLEEIKFKLHLWSFFPLFISNELIYGRYGTVSLTDLFRLQKRPFPVSPVTYNLLNNLQFRYFASKRLSVRGSIIYRRHAQHYTNRFSEQGNWLFKLGLQYVLTTKWALN